MSSLDHSAATMDPDALEAKGPSDFHMALLSMAAHDLRQPLQVIQSAYDWLGTRVGASVEKARLRRGERAIATLAEQLDRLVGALRLYEQTSTMEIAPVALSAVFARLRREYRAAAREKGIDLRVCPTRSSVMSNALLLEGVLHNLVRNAIKYTDPGGRVLIGCRRSGADVRIDVGDTGIGMAPEQLPRIFEAFQRLDSTRSDGLGLGLMVVRRAIMLLGHRIEVQSAPSCGSRFSVFARAALRA